MFPLLILLVAAPVGCKPPSVRPEPQSPSDYALTVRVLPSAGRLEVKGTVRIPPADSERAELRCSLSPRMSAMQVEVVEPSVSAGTARLERVDSGDRPRVEGERGNVKWVLRPQRPIPPGQSTLVKFSYEGSGEAGFIHYVGPEVAFASGWGDYWYPVFEGTSGTTGALTVHVPDGWTTVTGKPGSAHFTFIAGPYTVVRREGTVPLTAYLLSPRAQIDKYLADVASMVNVLSAEFGPFAFDELLLVEVPRELAIRAGFNAFSPAGMVVLNSRAFDVPEVKYLLEWLGHEIGHQWFPHAVTWDPPGFLYLEEALAEYGGLRVVEELAGPEAARRTRTSGFEYDPIYSASAYFKQVGAGVDRPLADMDSGIDQRNLAYNKGALVFDMLSREVGRATMQRVFHDLTRGRQFQTITWTDFVKAVTARSSQNLDWFFEQWLERAGAPDFQLSWTESDGSVRVTVTQPAPFYRAHLKVEIRGDKEDQPLIQVVDISGPRTELTITPGFPARSVVLDPDYEVLRWTPEFRAMADAARSAPRP
jgi:hypothetical protein